MKILTEAAPYLVKELSAAQAAERLGVSSRRVRQFVEQGRLEARKLAGILLIKETDLEAFARKPRRRWPKP